MNQVATLEPRPALMAGAKVQAIVPTSMDEAYRLAKAVCIAGMAPKGLDTPEKAMIAIMHGMEIGLTPMAALQRIAVVNGRPTIWGDGAMSLVRGSGACEWITEGVDGANDARTAVCEAKRKGDPKSIKRTFSVADAKKAGLWGKQGPWTQYADRMLQMRARAFCLRDGFADVLGGLYLKEELDDTEQSAPAQRQARTPPAPPPLTAIAPPVPPSEPAKAKTPPNPTTEPQSPSGPAFVLSALKESLDVAKSEEECNQAWEKIIDGSSIRLTDEQVDEAQDMLRHACSKFYEE